MSQQNPWPSAQEVAKAVREENERQARRIVEDRRATIRVRISAGLAIALFATLLIWLYVR